MTASRISTERKSDGAQIQILIIIYLTMLFFEAILIQQLHLLQALSIYGDLYSPY